jgi:sulfate adenylyltransferase
VTPNGDEGDTAGSARVVLDDSGLDRLELVLGGWLPPSAIADLAKPDGETTVTDAENTPLARIRAGADGAPTVEPLATLARGSGPQWDPAVRLAAAATRDRIGDGGGGGRVAVLIDDLPTNADVERIRHLAGGSDVGVVIVLVEAGRRPRGAGGIGWAGLTQAAWAVADEVAADTGARVVRLVIPRPAEGTLEPDLAAAGIDSRARLTDLRGGVPATDGDDTPASAIERGKVRRFAGGPGAVVLFTGLSGSGKSTIARALADELADEGSRQVTLLDGDEVRQHLSAELGFDAASRERNVERIGWVAALVARHGGIAIAAPIAPFEASRARVRAMAEAAGATFLLVWISTSLDVCEGRDRKGLYARARAGTLADFTGISSPYEAPADADVVIDTATTTVADATGLIAAALEARLGPGRFSGPAPPGGRSA